MSFVAQFYLLFCIFRFFAAVLFSFPEYFADTLSKYCVCVSIVFSAFVVHFHVFVFVFSCICPPPSICICAPAPIYFFLRTYLLNLLPAFLWRHRAMSSGAPVFLFICAPCNLPNVSRPPIKKYKYKS